MSEQQQPIASPPGWYPDPRMPSTLRYWDGGQWTARTTIPMRPPRSGPEFNGLVHGLALAAAAGGVILSAQSVTMMQGTGILWLGVALAVAAGIVGLATKAPMWTRVILILAAVIAFGSASATESELNDMRERLQTDLSQYE